MKRLLYIIIVSYGLMASMTACNKQENINDDKLTLIVRDIMLSNAVYDHNRSAMNLDSVDIYTPIFRKYGYHPDDFMFTIENLSKRKSVRFTDIIQQATAMVEAENNKYKYLLMMIDSVDHVSARWFQDTVYSDSIQHIKKRSNPKVPDISIPLKKGKYEISFVYFIDTTDTNHYLQYAHFVVDSAKVRKNDTFRTYMKNNRRRNIVELNYDGDSTNKLEIYLAYNSSTVNESKTDLLIDSLRVIHSLPKEIARDSVIKRSLPWYNSTIYPKIEAKIEANGTKDPKDYLTLRPDTTRVATGSDTIVRR